MQPRLRVQGRIWNPPHGTISSLNDRHLGPQPVSQALTQRPGLGKHSDWRFLWQQDAHLWMPDSMTVCRRKAATTVKYSYPLTPVITTPWMNSR